MNTYHITDNSSIGQINSYFRARDESHKWPINNKFNATERAIRRLRKLVLYTGGIEYFKALDAEIQIIINDCRQLKITYGNLLRNQIKENYQ